MPLRCPGPWLGRWKTGIGAIGKYGAAGIVRGHKVKTRRLQELCPVLQGMRRKVPILWYWPIPHWHLGGGQVAIKAGASLAA